MNERGVVPRDHVGDQRGVHVATCHHVTAVREVVGHAVAAARRQDAPLSQLSGARAPRLVGCDDFAARAFCAAVVASRVDVRQ